MPRSAEWTPRDGAMLGYLAGKWRLFGGWDPIDPSFPGSPKFTTNEVWSSATMDQWTLDLPHAATPPTDGEGARFKRRHWFGVIPYKHLKTEYLYILGGDQFSAADADFINAPSNGYQCDVWRTADGTTMERVATSDSVSWSGRMLVVFGASPGKLWAFGGQNGLLREPAAACVIHNDLHVSADGGATWTVAIPDAPPSTTQPSGRGIVNRLAYWNKRLWLVGGGTYDCAGFPDRQYFSEVWSIHPNNLAAGWTEHAAPPWLGTTYTAVEVYRDQL